MTKPFNTCEYCGRVCEFRKPALEFVTTQSVFIDNISNLIKNNNIKESVSKVLEKSSSKIGEKSNPLSINQRALTYCIFAHIINDLFPSESKEEITNLMKEIKKNLVILFKEASENAPSETSSPIVAEKTNQESLNLDQEKLLKERELLRKQTQKTTSLIEESTTKESSISISDVILNWIRSDIKFIKIVKNLSKISGGILIEYDPETEGYLSSLKIQYAQKTFNFGDEIIPVTKLRILTQYDIKYGHDIAIGYGGAKQKDIVATYFVGELPKDEKDILDALKQVNIKDVSELDRLTLILNGDKKLRKNIENLPLKSPLPQKVDDIKIPITIKSRGTNLQIACVIFFNEKVKPSSIFLDVLEKLAEDIDNLADVDEKVRLKTASETGLFEVEEKSYTPTEFHFLTMGSTIEVKTCPNCGKPFPDSEADYRRCPHCLFKLK